MSKIHSRFLAGWKTSKPNKFGAIKKEYNGIKYDSKREAKEAALLDLEVKAKTVLKWERQHKIPLVVNGVKLCNYVIDFKVYHADGRVEYREVKGAETQLWKLKFKLAKALYPNWEFTVVR